MSSWGTSIEQFLASSSAPPAPSAAPMPDTKWKDSIEDFLKEAPPSPAAEGPQLLPARPGPTDPRAVIGRKIMDVFSPITDLFQKKPSAQAVAAAPFDKTQLPATERPLLKLSAMDAEGNPQTIAAGARRGALEAVEGFTSPQGIAMIAGLGKLAKFGSAARALTAAIGAGFDVSMIASAVGQVPEAKALWDKGQQAEAARIAVHALMTGGMGAFGARGKMTEMGSAPSMAPAPEPAPVVQPAPPPKVGPPGPVMTRAQRRASAAVPETGVPEGVDRAMSEREAIIGKPRDQWTNSDVIAADELRAQGYTGARPSETPVAPSESAVHKALGWTVSPEDFLNPKPAAEAAPIAQVPPQSAVEPQPPAHVEPASVPPASAPTAGDVPEPVAAPVELVVAPPPPRQEVIPPNAPVETAAGTPDEVAPATATPEPPSAKPPDNISTESKPPSGPFSAASAWIKPSDISLDPVRFQFKQEGVGQKGVTSQFKDVTEWDPDLAGTVHVWRDPADGKTYAVNGHHRAELAQRLGEDKVPEMHVRYLDAQNAQQARAKGALANIADGNGTALDIAKFFRDSEITPEQLEAQGKIKIIKKVSQQGAAISKLSQPLFDDFVSGALKTERAAVIGEGLASHADQKVLYDVIKKRARDGRRLTDDQIQEMIRLANGGEKKPARYDDGQGGLFDSVQEVEQSLLGEKAEISDYVRKQLSGEKKLFGLVGNETAASRLGEVGNVIKAGENAQRADQANQGLLVYDKLSNSAGPVDAILARAAKELADGGNANDIKKRAYDDIRAEVQGQAAKLSGVPAGVGPASEGLREGRVDQSGPGEHPAAAGGDGELAAADTPPEDLFSSTEVDKLKSDSQRYEDQILHDQLTAQLRSGGPAKPARLKEQSGDRGLFNDNQPKQEGMFDASPEDVAAAKARIKDRIGNLFSDETGEQVWHIDPRDFQDLIVIGKDYVRQVGKNFDKFSDAMKAEFGDKIEPYLLKIYTQARQSMGDGPQPPAPGRAPLPMPKPIRESLADAGLSLVENDRPVNQAAKVVQFPGRESQRGSFSTKAVPQTWAEKYAQEQVDAREKARTGPIRDAWTKVKRGMAKIKAEGIAGSAPIIDAIEASKKAYNYDTPARMNMEYWIGRVRRASSIADKILTSPISQGGYSLHDLIKRVDNSNILDQFLIAKHARTVEAVKGDKPVPLLDDQGRSKVTGRDMEKDARLIDETKDLVAIPATKTQPAMTYGEVAGQVNQYARNLLDQATDAGLISTDLRDHLVKTYPDYVPLNRIFSALEDANVSMGIPRGLANLGKQTVVRELVGSGREIENPLASLIHRTLMTTAQAERNIAAKTLADHADLPGMRDLIHEVGQGEKTPTHNFHYLDNGKLRTFETTPEIASAAKSLDVHSIGILGKIFAAPARIFKTGTTGLNPAFILSNIVGDMGHTGVASKYDSLLANPGVFTRALFAAVKHDALWDEIVKSGAGFTSFDVSRDRPMGTIDNIRAGRSVGDRLAHAVVHPLDSAAHLLRTAEDLASRSEEFGRARLYLSTKEALMKQGRSEADAKIMATVEANNALPDYLESGDVMKPFNAAIPYFNAGIQGARSFVRAIKRDPVGTSAKYAIGLMMPVAAATLWNVSDPERKKAYADMAEYEKEGRLIIVPPHPQKDAQGRWDVYAVKLPPGMGRLTSVVRRLIEQGHAMDPVKMKEVADSVIGTFSPIEPKLNQIASSVTPQVIKPTVQALANYDFFRDKPKVPGRMQDLPTEMQAHPYTSGTAKAIGNAVGASPIKTEEFIKDTLGGVGSQVLNLSDRALAAAGKIPANEVGGISPLEAVASRFSKARGGEMDNKEYQARVTLEQSASRLAVERAKKTPYFSTIKGNEEAAQRYLNAVALRAKALVVEEAGRPRYKRMEAEQKLAELKRLTPIIERKASSAATTRPASVQILPPSKIRQYALPR